MTDWIEETLHPDFRFKMKVDRVLFEGRSENQHVAIVENQTAEHINSRELQITRIGIAPRPYADLPKHR